MTTRWTWAVGVAALTGCGTPINTTGGFDSGSTAGGNQCNEACAAQARANCSAFQMGTCVSGCQSSLTMFPQCSAPIGAVSRCLASATFTCSSTTNRPATASCQAETAAFVRCVSPDAGP